MYRYYQIQHESHPNLSLDIYLYYINIFVEYLDFLI